MASLTLLAPFLVLLAGSAAAKSCTDFIIPVDILSRQGLFKKVPLETNLDVTAFAQELLRNGQNYTATLLEDYQTLKGSYKISAKFCHPEGGIGESVVQLLSHGIGFDKAYWDLPYNDYSNSYTDAALKEGYSVLAIDRLGIGMSSHGDPFNEIQAQAEVEALNAVTTKLRKGEVPEIGHSFAKVIHVGHSFGSIQSLWLSALYPNNTDGLVLTGWAATGDFTSVFWAGWNMHSARLNQPLRFGNASSSGLLNTYSAWKAGDALIKGIQMVLNKLGVGLSPDTIWEDIATTEVSNLIRGYNETTTPLDYASGYVSWSDFTANQFCFLHKGHYDLGLGLFSEANKQPMTVGEALTIGSFPQRSSFSGPVLVFTGREDLPFCGGDCLATGTNATSIPAGAKALFPKATPFEAYIQPDTAHGINAHYNATGAYQVINSWLGAHGLGA
ncbi:Alpha/Beta hydrolase protein [Massariosphaeria phaeospora]|uniref:Alpha/Beta hydrolase protein n=1 Tax=Massariosphaeria phaeospora TaxID=100035 RepID=A0A7C8MFI8_9PLEO|nr:Alpha/Beta hydrolase protein [Massariosphaeria phaeospora]